jgi:cell division ATPase FtsA
MISLKPGKRRPRVSLEIGHSTLRLAILRPGEPILSFFDSPCMGYTKGKVTDASALEASLRALFTKTGLTADDCDVSLIVPPLNSGFCLKTVELRTNGVYRPTDWERARTVGLDSIPGEFDEPIDAIPISIHLDGREIAGEPFGAPGRDALVKMAVFTYPRTLLVDLMAVLNSAGIKISALRSTGYCLSSALKFLRPQSENSVVLDLGHHSTAGVVFVGGQFVDYFWVPVGGHHMINDLRAGANLSQGAAYDLIRQWGALPSSSAPAEMSAYLRPRVSELVRLVSRYFALYAKSLDGGLLLVGGSSQLKGLGAFFSRHLGIEAPFIGHFSGVAAQGFFAAGTPISTDACEAGISLTHLWSARELALESAQLSKPSSPALARLRPLWTWLSELSE